MCNSYRPLSRNTCAFPIDPFRVTHVRFLSTPFVYNMCVSYRPLSCNTRVFAYSASLAFQSRTGARLLRLALPVIPWALCANLLTSPLSQVSRLSRYPVGAVCKFVEYLIIPSIPAIPLSRWCCVKFVEKAIIPRIPFILLSRRCCVQVSYKLDCSSNARRTCDSRACHVTQHQWDKKIDGIGGIARLRKKRVPNNNGIKG